MARNTRATKNTSSGSSKNVKTNSKTRRASQRHATTQQDASKQKGADTESDADYPDEESDAYVDDEGDEEDETVSLDSDTLDDPDFDTSGRKRKRVSSSKKASPKKSNSSTRSPSKKKRVPLSDEEEEAEDVVEVVGTVVQAPKTGRVPPGQISQNTLKFLRQLQDPDCNDRTWFKLHDPVYRLAEKEWKDFIDEFTPLLTEADPEIPVLPPNDVVHRIYRDIRFSNDKTPYKTNFSASFSRSGRKDFLTPNSIKITLKPGGSLFAAGSWCPGKNELQTIRNNILRSSRRLRQVISEPAFVELFGEPKRHPKGQRRNIFGMEDELKVAPKGVDKTHKDIDLLKCRSFAVVHRFTDKEVLDPDFKEEVKRIVTITRPFVRCLNDLMTVAPPDDDDSGVDSDEGADS